MEKEHITKHSFLARPCAHCLLSQKRRGMLQKWVLLEVRSAKEVENLAILNLDSRAEGM